MSTLALGLYKIRGAWPRPPSLGLRPISPCVPGFYESGRDSAHFLFDARYGAKDFFYSLRAGKTAAAGRVRHTISCGALFPEKSGFFHRRQQENHRIFHSWGLIHSRLSPLSTERKNKISENATRKNTRFRQNCQKAPSLLTGAGNRVTIECTSTIYGACFQKMLRNFVIAARRFLYGRGKWLHDRADCQTRRAQSPL